MMKLYHRIYLSLSLSLSHSPQITYNVTNTSLVGSSLRQVFMRRTTRDMLSSLRPGRPVMPEPDCTKSGGTTTAALAFFAGEDEEGDDATEEDATCNARKRSLSNACARTNTVPASARSEM